MILLVDMDAFFASVEQAHQPHLRGLPVIVCGDPQRRGVVTAASYEARPFGVRAGMPLGEARRLCPQAQYIEGNPSKYVALSLKLLQFYLTHTPDVEPFSVDEAFLRVGGSGITLEGAREIASRIQSGIRERFGLSASIGIGPNKLVAKMASGVSKPSGLTAFDEAAFRAHFGPLPAREMWGIGPQLEERLTALGIRTVCELAAADSDRLRGAFGVIGPQLKEAANGRDDTPLVPYHEGVDPKSMGHEVTLAEDSEDPAFIEGTLLRLSDQVGRRLRGEGFVGRTVAVKLRDHAFRTRIRQRVLATATDDHSQVFEVARALWGELWRGERVRLIGVSLTQLSKRSEAGQLEMFTGDTRAQKLREALDRVRDKLGEASVVPAGTLAHRSRSTHVPFGALKRRDPGSRPRDSDSGRSE
ncbi:MAG: DNA polymerase IV [Candidatus Eisenbacteria bacterium]|uniref:DNA polymerase IV n=1 Tax=Eiseniibacteriota bacterium TaxID=2212470 RepID=A0A849SYE9_UNCEI|nr:DNA polymerase IV [Candidatus Eisenbacteria bacterium]